MLWWGIAAVLLASWLFPSTREYWDILDNTLFFALNGTLKSGETWQAIWAIANWRPFDIVAASLIAAISMAWVYRLDMNQRLAAISGLIILLLLILCTRLLTTSLLSIMEYQRHSPSIILTPSYRLNEMISWIETKDYHKDCFPGDHGYVIIACMTFFFIKADRKSRMISLVLLAPFIMPRLVSGAHWATDIIIGSTTMALISLPLLFATPIYHHMVKAMNALLEYAIAPILRMLQLTD